jgi:hypothetical protein
MDGDPGEGNEVVEGAPRVADEGDVAVLVATGHGGGEGEALMDLERVDLA